MSLNEAVRFTERMLTDEDLQRRAAAAVGGKSGPEATQALLALAATEGLHINAEEMVRVRDAALAATELSEEDLGRVAGGLSLEEWEEKLQSTGDDSELADMDLEGVLRRQQQAIAAMGSVSSVTLATAMSLIRRVS